MVTDEPEIQGCWAVDPGKCWPGNSASSLNKVGGADPRRASACPKPALPRRCPDRRQTDPDGQLPGWTLPPQGGLPFSELRCTG